MKTFNYNVFAFRQQEKSPIQVAFVAHAGQMLEWVGVPRKSDELLTGYQRFLDKDRIDKEILPFFQDPKNSSPTAIILALRKDSGLGSCILQNSDVPVGEVISTVLTINLDDAAIASDSVFHSAKEYVEARLNRDGVASAQPEIEEDEQDIEEDDDDESLSDNGNEDSQQVIHLGTGTLQKMKELLNDQANWSNSNFREAIIDYVKHAFIIDGQHRITTGAKLGMNGLPFIVCGLYDAAWEEQVFQFTVVNLKPKRIPPSVIASIAGLSLTRTERELVERRLRQAKIDVGDATIMSLIAFCELS